MAEENEVGVEQDILNSIGEGNADANEIEQTNETTTETTQERDQTKNNEAGQNGETNSEGSTTEQTTQQATGPQDLKLADGTIIKGGAERRLFERGQKLQRDLDQTKSQLTEASAKLEAFESASNLGTQFGLSPEELTTGAQLIAAYKSDPVATIKHMLTEAQTQGHNIEGLGGTTDMSAIRAMIQEAVQPLTSKFNEEQEAQQARDQATKVWNDFQTEHPDAVVHEDALAQLLREDSSLSLPAAYFKLRSMYLERNLDWTKPLAKLQEEARQQPANTAQTEQLPSGGNVSQGNVTDTSEVADVDTPLDDIIKQSMRDAGIN